MDILWNKIEDEGFAAVISCIDKIDELYIGSDEDDHLSIDGITALYKAIQNQSFRVSQIKQFAFTFIKMICLKLFCHRQTIFYLISLLFCILFIEM